MPKGSYEFLCCDNKNSIATESGKTNVKVRWQQTAMQCERRRKIGELLPKVERLTSKSGGSRRRCSASGERVAAASGGSRRRCNASGEGRKVKDIR